MQSSRCGLSHAPANSRQPARCIAFFGPERGGAVVSAPEDALGGALASLVEAPGRYKPPSLPTWSRFTRTEDERRKEMPAQTQREDGDFVRAPCAERSYPVVTQRQDQAKRVTVRNVSGGPKTAKNGI